MNRRNFFARAIGAVAAVLHKPPTFDDADAYRALYSYNAGYRMGVDVATGPDRTTFAILESTQRGLGLKYWEAFYTEISTWPSGEDEYLAELTNTPQVEYWRES